MFKGFKYLRTVITVIISIICCGIAVSIVYIKVLNPSPISKRNKEKEFSKNKEILSSVAKYLEKQEYVSIYITSTNKKRVLFTSENDKGVDLIATNITDLFEKYNYSVITKDGNGIYFQRWSNA